MKNHYKINRLIISIYISTLLLTSCVNNIEISENNIQMSQKVKMTLNGTLVDFDEETTRSTSTDWKNGDILYLRFHTSNGIVTGSASYDSNKDWIVNYYGSLERDSEEQVEIIFFDDPSLKVENNIVYLTENTAIYQDFKGTYTYVSSGEIHISTMLQPITSRIRFKGKSDEWIMTGGLDIFSSYDVTNGSFSISNKFLITTVNESGYTNYIYGICSDKTTPQIKINKQEEDGWSYLYTMNCSGNIMAIGKSGWINIPTQKSRNGWSMKQVYGEENGHDWVDLGLPSGTKWAYENIGADIAQWQDDGLPSNVLGNYYHWGETSSYDGCLSDKDIQGNVSYDTAKSQWGGKWVMPSKIDYEELLSHCTLTNEDNAYGTISAYEVCGNTGETIWLPYPSSSLGSRYWTSTPADDTEEQDLINHEWIWNTHRNAWIFYVGKKEYSIKISSRYCSAFDQPYYTGRLRAIIKP